MTIEVQHQFSVSNVSDSDNTSQQRFEPARRSQGGCLGTLVSSRKDITNDTLISTYAFLLMLLLIRFLPFHDPLAMHFLILFLALLSSRSVP